MNTKKTWTGIVMGLGLLGWTVVQAQDATVPVAPATPATPSAAAAPATSPSPEVRAKMLAARRAAATAAAAEAMEPVLPSLKQNVTLTLETSGPKGDVPIQITWSGAGPKLYFTFLTPWPTAANLTNCVSGSLQGTIRESAGGYLLEYKVEGYEPQEPQNTTVTEGLGNVTLPEKSEYAVQSVIMLKLGEPVTDAASAVVLAPKVGPVNLTCPVKLTLTVAK